MKIRIRFWQSLISFLMFVSAVGYADNFIVNNTQDSGAGSFRQALMDANSHPGADSVRFNIPLSDPNHDESLGVWVIQPDSSLPYMTDDSTTIDGMSQADFIGTDSNALLVRKSKPCR